MNLFLRLRNDCKQKQKFVLFVHCVCVCWRVTAVRPTGHTHAPGGACDGHVNVLAASGGGKRTNTVGFNLAIVSSKHSQVQVPQSIFRRPSPNVRLPRRTRSYVGTNSRCVALDTSMVSVSRDLQCLSACNPRMSGPRSAENNVMLVIKEVRCFRLVRNKLAIHSYGHTAVSWVQLHGLVSFDLLQG